MSVQMEKIACVKPCVNNVAFSENYYEFVSRSFVGMDRCDL